MHPAMPSSAIISSKKAPQSLSPGLPYAVFMCLVVEGGKGGLTILNISRGTSANTLGRMLGQCPAGIHSLAVGSGGPGEGRDAGVDGSWLCTCPSPILSCTPPAASGTPARCLHTDVEEPGVEAMGICIIRFKVQLTGPHEIPPNP